VQRRAHPLLAVLVVRFMIRYRIKPDDKIFD
jgi:hypothetical protein